MAPCIVVIERQDLSEKEQAYLQEHLLITTALYGVLPAYEGIVPHPWIL